MKKLLFSTLSVILLFVACSKEEQAPPPPPTPTYTLSFSAEAGGSVSSEGGTYNEGSKITVTATPDAQYLFKEWSDGSTVNPREITVTSNLTLKASFIKKTYPLAVNIEGEGTVQEEVIIQGSTSETTYNAGTTVRLTATPNEGWVFAGWSGDVESEELEIEVPIEKGMSVTALFYEEKDFYYSSNIIQIPTDGFDPRSVDQTLYNVSGPFHYSAGGEDFMLFPGVTPLDIDVKSPSIILKRSNNEWDFHRKDFDAAFFGPRNFEINENKFAIGDGNERGADAIDWKGDVWYGEILVNGNIEWQKVNQPESEGYYHGTCIGDLNADGLIDVGGTPIWIAEKSQYRIKTFLQNPDGTFTDKTSYMDEVEEVPFTVDFANIFGDDRDEIITADYGGGDPFTNPNLNNLKIYSYNEEEDNYQLHFSSNESTAFYDRGLGATSIQAVDFDNDGLLDIAVAREGGTNEQGLPGVENWQLHAMEVWRNVGNGEFEAHWSTPIWDERQMQFREFRVFDVNQDGYMDIVLRPFHHGTLYNGEPWPHGKDLLFNHLIWMNQGDGTFSHFDGFDFKIEDIENNNVHPYMKDGKLCFIGSVELQSNDPSNRRFNIHHIEADLRGY